MNDVLAPVHELGALQRWMQSVLTGEGAWAERLAAARDAHGIGVRDAVAGSNRLTPEERLSVYARGYVLRFLECLRAEFPVLHRLVGDQVFDLFAIGYIEMRPSHSYTLYDLGAGFADFLEATRPPGCTPGALEALPASLARLERARAEAHRARGLEDSPDEAMPASVALLLTPGACLRTPDTVRLLRLDFDFLPTLAAAANEKRPDMPDARETLVAVSRRHYRVVTQPLTPSRFAWLEALGPDGADVQGAVVRAAEASGQSVGATTADLFLWMPIAAQAGLVTQVAAGP